VFTAAKTLRERNTFQREDGTPLQYTLVNIKDWCKNEFEVINQLRINTENSHHRYDVILLVTSVITPCSAAADIPTFFSAFSRTRQKLPRDKAGIS